jgi:membrane protease YdiL (CAAX protease family)
MRSLIRIVKNHPVVSFFSLAFILEAVVTFLCLQAPAVLPFALTLIPLLTALALAGVEVGGAVGALLKRMVLWRVGLKWYLAVLGVPALVMLITVLVGALAGAQVAPLASRITPSLLIVFLVVFLPALGEESGFRGYVIPKLLEGRSALAAALIVGVLWTIFHLPLFLPGQLYEHLLLWPLPFEIMGMAVFLTWIFVNTRGSVLMTSLFHAAMNGLTPVTAVIQDTASWEIRGIVLVALAVVVVLIWGPSLMRRPAAQAQAGSASAIGSETR